MLALQKCNFTGKGIYSLGLSATSHLYFSLRTNQQPASSTLLSEQTSTSHQPTEHAGDLYAENGMIRVKKLKKQSDLALI
jgi:hypothetical protein